MRRDIQPYSTAGSRGSFKKKSPADRARDLRRAAQHNRVAIEAALVERGEAWESGGRDEYLAARQDATRVKLGERKRELRRDVFDERPELEGREYRGTISMRSTRA